jgi:hypothetical protein
MDIRIKITESIDTAKKDAKTMKCPKATKDLELNTKNRDLALKKFNYGPLNVDEPGDYWEKVAKYWKTTVDAVNKSLCGNCIAFDTSPRMKDCMPGDTFDDDGELGYCWMHHFKCHSARSCHTWAKGGPIDKNSESHEWQKKNQISERILTKIQEKKWSKKYKSSIDCNNPKGFSQKAHCAGKSKRDEK